MNNQKTAIFALWVFNNEEQRLIINNTMATMDHVIDALYGYGFRDNIPEFIFSYLETEDTDWEFFGEWSVTIEYLGSK